MDNTGFDFEYFVTFDYYLDHKTTGKFCFSINEAQDVAKDWANESPGEEVIVWDLKEGRRAFRCYVPEPDVIWEKF